MSVVAPPPPVIPPEQDELERLIREARARQRRRRLGAAAGTAIALVGLSVYAGLMSSGRKTAHGPGTGRPAAPSSCRTDQLRLSWVANGASAGEGYTDGTFTNVSARSCALYGWPTLAYELRAGQIVIGAGRERNGTQSRTLPIRSVVLGPHGAASFNLRTADTGMFSHPLRCFRIRALLITPPGARVALRSLRSGRFCGRALQSVTPLVPGQLDRYLVEP